MIKGTQAESDELGLAEIKIQHQNWLQSPETRMVFKALSKHAENHTAIALQASIGGADANAVKQQAAIAYNLNLVLDIIQNPELLHKLLNPPNKDNNNS